MILLQMKIFSTNEEPDYNEWYQSWLININRIGLETYVYDSNESDCFIVNVQIEWK